MINSIYYLLKKKIILSIFFSLISIINLSLFCDFFSSDENFSVSSNSVLKDEALFNDDFISEINSVTEEFLSDKLIADTIDQGNNDFKSIVFEKAESDANLSLVLQSIKSNLILNPSAKLSGQSVLLLKNMISNSNLIDSYNKILESKLEYLFDAYLNKIYNSITLMLKNNYNDVLYEQDKKVVCDTIFLKCLAKNSKWQKLENIQIKIKDKFMLTAGQKFEGFLYSGELVK